MGEQVKKAVERALADRSDVEFDRLAYSRSKNKFIIFLKSKSFLTREQVSELLGYLILALEINTLKTEIHIDQSEAAVDLSPAQVAEAVVDCIAGTEKAYLPMFEGLGAKLEKEQVDLIFTREFAPEFVKQMGLKHKIEEELQKLYGIPLKIRDLSVEMKSQIGRAHV